MNCRIPILLVAFCLVLYSCGKNPAGPPDEPVDQIAFRVGEALYIMDLSTDSTWKVVEPVWPGGLRWSPDGERIAYTGPFDYYEAYQIYVINADGSGKRLVTLWDRKGHIEPHIDGGMMPVWSPDGDKIAFSRCINCEIGGLNTEIFIIDLDTTDGIKEVKLTDNPYGDFVFDWSPDGQKILFHSNCSLDSIFDRYGDWYTMNIDGTDKQRILLSDSTFGSNYARYSPDGKHIAIASGRENSEIYILNADGSDMQRITNNEIKEEYVLWSPDGTRLTFIAGSIRTGGHICIINSDGTGLTQITTGEAKYFTPEWRPYTKH
ncbi:MAG: hypothetical protein ACETWG_06620 [Candidatus Neomarinimicrobiota bacterium]